MKKSIKTSSLFSILALTAALSFNLASHAAENPAPANDSPAPLVECQPRGGLPNFVAKLQRGGEVRIGYLGGSITAQDGWRPKTLRWFQEQFTNARLREINAAIGGTGSDLGVFRLQQDVLAHRPDLLFVEFAVNDAGTSPEQIHRSMEGIVRQTWRANPETDLCFVYTLANNMLETYLAGQLPRSVSAMEKLAAHYAIPTINFGPAVAALQKEGRLVFSGPKPKTDAEKAALGDKILFSPDAVHPYTDTGHQLYLDAVIRSWPQLRGAGQVGPRALGTPLVTDHFSAAKLVPLNHAKLSTIWQKLDPTNAMALATVSLAAAELPEKRIGRDGAEMVLVPAGSFLMGSLDGESDEAPPRAVTLPAFYIDQFEITHAQYATFLSATGRKPPLDWPAGKMPEKLARHPVVNVTFDDAAAYAQWAGKRLPTEAEWEKASRGADGRTFPWGDSAARKKSATPLGDNSKDHTWPVGSFPDDVSPCGAMDLAGNVWEWTDSWYDAYPGNDHLEVEYGRKYRVIRGGGAIDYYGAPSTRRCADRARSVPYGTFDGLGFRCALDAEFPPASRHQASPPTVENTARPPGRMAEADQKTAPTNLATTSVAKTLRLPLTVAEPVGVARIHSPVTSGVPFPMGALPTNAALRLRDEQGRLVPLQAQATAMWRDGSLKWLLLDFQTDAAASAERHFTLEADPNHPDERIAQAPERSITTRDTPDAIRIDTGALRFAILKNRLGLLESAEFDANANGLFETGELALVKGLMPFLTLSNATAADELRVQPPEEVALEETGPLRAVVRVSGWLTEGDTNRLVKYLFRIHASAGSSSVRIQFTVTQLSERMKMLWVRAMGLTLQPLLPAESNYLLGGQPAAHSGTLTATGTVLMTQLDESRYDVCLPDGGGASGTKAPGWLNLGGRGHGLFVGISDYWQQFPKAVSVSGQEIRLGLYPFEAGKPFDMDQGLAKTHEIFVTFHDGTWTADRCEQEAAALDHPLFATAPPSWYCDSKAFGDLLPFDFDRFPDYETLTEASGDQFIRRMATGFRHWGDVYYGGEYKGTNSYMNLEYDVHHNFYCQFARTGLRKYLDTAIRMARHQADIDTNHKTGWQWKHSPRHVEIQAEFGHTFTRGLLETYFLTGNRRCREAAIELGDYFAKEIQNPRSTGNERQIGWGLISLLPVFEATWDAKFFLAASNTVERLIRGLDERGKFNIRWDNRIAFFNGIAATGFLYYHRATGDERVADAAYRVIRRARGFYPEYAGRTLEAIAWACQRTREPEWFDFLKLTWETTLARSIQWNTMELGAPTIFTVHSLPYLAGSGALPAPERPLQLTPAQFDSANGLFAHHLPSGEAELWLNVTNLRPFDLVVIRKGAWKAPGNATLLDPTGRTVASLDFAREGVVWQRRVLPATPTVQGAWRLALRSASSGSTRGGGSFVTWDVATSRPMRAVFSTPDWQNLQFVTPALYTAPRGDSSKIEIELAGEGEGFKKAVLYDPDGNVAGSTEAFIDLGDKGRYFYKVSAAIPPRHQSGLWRLVLQDVSVVNSVGLLPYFATSPQDFFRPEQTGARHSAGAN